MSWFTIEMWLFALAITIVLIGGFSIFARWCLLSPAVPQRKLDKLAVGMKQEEVLKFLGEPSEIRPGENDYQFWLYRSRFKRHLLVAKFSSNGTLTEFVHGVPHSKHAGRGDDD